MNYINRQSPLLWTLHMCNGDFFVVMMWWESHYDWVQKALKLNVYKEKKNCQCSREPKTSYPKLMTKKHTGKQNCKQSCVKASKSFNHSTSHKQRQCVCESLHTPSAHCNKAQRWCAWAVVVDTWWLQISFTCISVFIIISSCSVLYTQLPVLFSSKNNECFQWL